MALLVAVFGSVIMLVMTSFVVDLGMQRVARSDMQALADVVSLDLARQVNGVRSNAAIAGDPAWTSGVKESVARNLFGMPADAADAADDQAKVEVTLPAPARPAVTTVRVQGATTTLTVTTGTLDEHGANFTPAAEPPNAVRVETHDEVDYVVRPGSGHVNRAAVAENGQWGCFKAGSWAGRVALDGLLPTQIEAQIKILTSQLNAWVGLPPLGGGVDILSYNGLAHATVQLADLVGVAPLSVASLDELLTTELSVANLITTMATVMQNNGTTVEANAAAAWLNLLATNASALGNVSLGEILHVDTAPPAVADVGLNVLDLIASTIAVANGGNFAEVDLPVDIGLVNPKVGLSVIEPPQIYCGPPGGDPISTAQVKATITSDINTTINLATGPNVSLVVNPTPGTLSIEVGVAESNASLLGVKCAPDSMQVQVQNALASANVDLFIPIRFELTTTSARQLVDVDPSFLGIDLRWVRARVTRTIGANVHVSTGLNATAPGAALDLQMPPNDVEPLSTHAGLGDGLTLTLGSNAITGAFPENPNKYVNEEKSYIDDAGNPVSVSPGILESLLGTVLNGLFGTLDAVLQPTQTAITGLVTGMVNPLLGSVDGLLDDLDTLLPVNTAGADVWAGPDAPTCATTSLRQ